MPFKEKRKVTGQIYLGNIAPCIFLESQYVLGISEALMITGVEKLSWALFFYFFEFLLKCS